MRVLLCIDSCIFTVISNFDAKIVFFSITTKYSVKKTSIFLFFVLSLPPHSPKSCSKILYYFSSSIFTSASFSVQYRLHTLKKYLYNFIKACRLSFFCVTLHRITNDLHTRHTAAIPRPLLKNVLFLRFSSFLSTCRVVASS